MWDIISKKIKNLKDLDELKRKIRDWETKNSYASFVEFIYITLGILIKQIYAKLVDNIHIVCKLCMRIANQYAWHTFMPLIHGQINLIKLIESNEFDNVYNKIWHNFVWSNQFDQILKK